MVLKFNKRKSKIILRNDDEILPNLHRLYIYITIFGWWNTRYYFSCFLFSPLLEGGEKRKKEREKKKENIGAEEKLRGMSG